MRRKFLCRTEPTTKRCKNLDFNFGLKFRGTKIYWLKLGNICTQRTYWLNSGDATFVYEITKRV